MSGSFQRDHGVWDFFAPYHSLEIKRAAGLYSIRANLKKLFINLFLLARHKFLSRAEMFKSTNRDNCIECSKLVTAYLFIIHESSIESPISAVRYLPW